MNMVLREETGEDYGRVFELIKAAFETAEHSDGNEHDLSSVLRKSDAFVPALSLVAEMDGELAGPISGAVIYAKEFGM